jgi:hypothetical protein
VERDEMEECNGCVDFKEGPNISSNMLLVTPGPEFLYYGYIVQEYKILMGTNLFYFSSILSRLARSNTYGTRINTFNPKMHQYDRIRLVAQLSE